MDDYDYDDYDLDDGWLYAEDEFDLADELAENQHADPGYSGTAFEIAMDQYEFELFAYWDDLEYADDAYWDYGAAQKEDSPAGVKRKREAATKKNGVVDKRRRTTFDRQQDPLLFISREERNRAFFADAPMLEGDAKYTFLADWKVRYKGEEGVVDGKDMPVDMKRAAEAKTLETPEKVVAGVEDGGEEMDEEEGDWEDDNEEEEEGEGLTLDPDMLKEILKQKLGAGGLEGMDESAFMTAITKMMSGEGDADDAAGDLANSLLGKLTSEPGGDSALSGWLSQQGVALEDAEDDDTASVATVDLPESLRHSGLSTRQSAQDSPIDSVVGGEAQQKGKTPQMPQHSGPPNTPSPTRKKRAAATIDATEKPNKKQKKVTFDVPPSSSSDPVVLSNTDLPTSEDPLMSESTLKERSTPQAGETKPTRGTRKRKAADEDAVDAKPPEKKRGRKKAAEIVESAATESPMGPPARRTRAAKAKAGK